MVQIHINGRLLVDYLAAEFERVDNCRGQLQALIEAAQAEIAERIASNEARIAALEAGSGARPDIWR
jgi:hypothetical protein